MKIQLALDTFELDVAIEVARELEDLVQVLEIGTPLVLKEGRRGIEKMRAAFPCHEILADYKIMDAGDLEAAVAFQAGASIVTVLAAANPATIRAAIDQAQRDGGKVMIDMIEAKNFADSVVQMDAFGAAYVQVHTAFDGRGDKSPLDELVTAKRLLKTHNAPWRAASGATISLKLRGKGRIWLSLAQRYAWPETVARNSNTF